MVCPSRAYTCPSSFQLSEPKPISYPQPFILKSNVIRPSTRWVTYTQKLRDYPLIIFSSELQTPSLAYSLQPLSFPLIKLGLNHFIFWTTLFSTDQTWCWFMLIPSHVAINIAVMPFLSGVKLHLLYWNIFGIALSLSINDYKYNQLL